MTRSASPPSPADAHAIVTAFAEVEAQLGRATQLVNTAGVADNVTAHEATPAQFRRVIDSSTSISTARTSWRRSSLSASSPQADRGVIVNISSMSGIVVNVPQPQAAFNASKADVAQLTRSLAVEWVPFGIRVNSVAPGYIATDMTQAVIDSQPEMAGEWLRRTPVGRYGTPQDVAPAVALLLSDGASFIIGHDLVVDGGYTIV